MPPPATPGRRAAPPGTAAAHALAGCAVAVLAAGGAAILTGQPWLFPSLGPTAMLQTEQPTSDSSTPRNTLVGHAVGLGAGYLALLAFGLTRAGPVLRTGVDARRMGAATVALAITAAVLLLLRRPHAPAGASTLIVSLGLLPSATSLAVAFAAVCLVTTVCWLYNRLTGSAMPLWYHVPGRH